MRNEKKPFYKIHYIGFHGISIGKMLRILEETHKKDDEVSFMQHLKAYKNSRWYDRYDYRYVRRKENCLIAFYSDFYFRQDHDQIFQNFIREFPMFDYVVPVRRIKDRFNFIRGLRMTGWDLCNLWLMRNVRISFRKKLSLIRVLGLTALYYKRMSAYLHTKAYSYGLVYSDSNPYENILVQYMKRKGIYTGTLQHGLFDKRAYWRGLEYRTSVADDFLAWSEYIKDLAMECGMSEQKIKVLGIPRYIRTIKVNKEEKNHIFGVILGNREYDEENKRLIGFANRLAGDQGLKYRLRYHPNCKGDEYDRKVKEQFLVQAAKQKEEISEMCNACDFMLIGSGTSVIIDLIYLQQPFMQYSMHQDKRKSNKRNNYFHNYEELERLIQERDALYNKEMFRYYCGTRDVKKSYAEYFKKIMADFQ